MNKLSEYVKVAEAASIMSVIETRCGLGLKTANFPCTVTLPMATGCSADLTRTSFYAKLPSQLAACGRRRRSNTPGRMNERMDASQFNWIPGYIWSIADDILRDLYVRGKYRDVILPMTVLRRLDAVLGPTK